MTFLLNLVAKPWMQNRIIGCQWYDEKLLECGNQIKSSDAIEGKLTVPQNNTELQEILVEAHNLQFFIHPGDTKMYRDLKCTYWWQGMNRDVARFVYV